MEGLPPEEVEELIPDNWEEKPMKRGKGKRFLNPNKPGESVMIEEGGGENIPEDNVHSGPYFKISKDGNKIRIPLEGNPTLGE